MDLAKSFRKIYHIEDATLEHLQASLSHKTFVKGERIITQGCVSNHLFIIEKGIVRCFYENLDEATETTLLFGIEGNLFTSLASVVYGQPSQTSYEALSDVTVLSISFDAFLETMRRVSRLNALAVALSALSTLHTRKTCNAYRNRRRLHSLYAIHQDAWQRNNI